MPGTPTWRNYHLLPMTTLYGLGVLSTLYRAFISLLRLGLTAQLLVDGAMATVMRQRPLKDQLVARWGPRHKLNLGDD